MKKVISSLVLMTFAHIAFSQSWGTTYPQVTGGYDVQYISQLHTTFGSGGGNIVTLRHDTITSTTPVPSVNKFSYFFDTLFAATNGSNSFKFFDGTWNDVPNVTLNERSFYLDTLGSNVLILSESSEPYPGHVIEYSGNQASTIPGLDVYTNSDHSVTYGGQKFITYISPFFEPHIFMWDGQSSLQADLPDNYGISNLFVTHSNLYATIIMVGIYQLWKYDGSNWEYVLQFPAGFNCQGAFNDNDQAVYFYGSTLYRCILPDTTLTHIESPITNSIYAMTRDRTTGMYYLSSNFIFWWDGKETVPTGISSSQPSALPSFRFDMVTNILFVDCEKQWSVFNNMGQIVANGTGRATKNLSYLPTGIYIVSSNELSGSATKFLITR